MLVSPASDALVAREPGSIEAGHTAEAAPADSERRNAKGVVRVTEPEPVAAVGLFMGPAHVLVAVNDGWVGEAPIGLPVSEAYPEPEYRYVQERMGMVYRTGIPVAVELDGRTMTIGPLREQGRVVGVGTYYAPARTSPASHPAQPDREPSLP